MAEAGGLPPVTPRQDWAYRAGSRALDLAVALSAGLLLAPVFLAVALAIKLTSPGPVLFRGTVHGKDGQPFTYYKFRSMAAGGDRGAHEAFIRRYVAEGGGHEQDGATVYKLTGDPRVTAVGRVIRRLSLDEFPQLINVVRGEMSVVGPRPPVPYEYELYDARKKLRLLVKPGITGLNQIRRRGQSSFEEMWADDLEYIRRQSLVLDLVIMLRTPWVMLFGAGPT